MIPIIHKSKNIKPIPESYSSHPNNNYKRLPDKSSYLRSKNPQRLIKNNHTYKHFNQEEDGSYSYQRYYRELVDIISKIISDQTNIPKQKIKIFIIILVHTPIVLMIDNCFSK